MASKMMQAEATKNTNVNIDALMNILGRYYQIRDDYQDINGTVLPPLFLYIVPS
jgi:geranylgeranyl pyrophosphate synthase